MKNEWQISFNKHFSLGGMFLTLIAMFLLLSASRFGVDGLLHWQEDHSEQTDWYKYTNVEPLKEAFAKKDDLVFISQVDYFRDIDMRWEDTLWCRQSGKIKKYDTQYWPADRGTERKLADGTNFFATDSDEVPTWSYVVNQPDSEATSCQMCGVVIGTTPKGYEKPWNYCTNWFEVNK